MSPDRNRLHMAVQAAPDDLEALGQRTHLLATQDRADGANLLFRKRREIGERALANPLTLTIRLAQQIGRA